MFLARSLISAAGTASRMIRTYVHYPTNRASSRTPLSSVLRCALSTTPDSDTSGSHSTMTIKVGVNPINISPDIPNVIQSSLSADSNSSVTAKSSLNKPMDRDERMAYLEGSIESKEAALVRLSSKTEALADERRVLLKLPESSRDVLLLKSIDDDLPDMREDKKRLATEIEELKAELSALKYPKEPADAPVPAQGM